MSRSAGVALTHVPYRGTAAGLADLLGGVLPAYIGAINGPVLEAHRDKMITIVTTTGTERSRYLPDVPTIVESGIKDAVAVDWTGILAPTGTSPEVVARLSAAFTQASKHPDFGKLLTTMGMDTLSLPQSAFVTRMKNEFETWRPIVKASGFSLDS